MELAFLTNPFAFSSSRVGRGFGSLLLVKPFDFIGDLRFSGVRFMLEVSL